MELERRRWTSRSGVLSDQKHCKSQDDAWKRTMKEGQLGLESGSVCLVSIPRLNQQLTVISGTETQRRWWSALTTIGIVAAANSGAALSDSRIGARREGWRCPPPGQRALILQSHQTSSSSLQVVGPTVPYCKVGMYVCMDNDRDVPPSIKTGGDGQTIQGETRNTPVQHHLFAPLRSAS